MPLRAILRYLANNEQLVQRLADSYPVRRVARFCVKMFYRTQDTLPPPGKIDSTWFRSFFNRFKNELSDGLKDAQKQIKNKK